MKSTTIFLITILVVASNQDSQPNHYWREFFGPIPPDSVVAGKDADGTIAYIGQGYYREQGVIPGRITPGVQIITVSWLHKNKLTKYVKILCGPQDQFYWMKVNASHLYMQLAHKHAVIGGHDDRDDEYLHIGRTTVNGTVIIGKALSYKHGEGVMYYVDPPRETEVSSYEILMYNTRDARSSAMGSTKAIYLYLVLTPYVLLQM